MPSHVTIGYHQKFVFMGALGAVVLRLRPALIRASLVLPSTPPLFQSIERHFLYGQFFGFSVCGIHLCPHTSQTRSIESEPASEGIPGGLASSENSHHWNHSLAAATGDTFLTSIDSLGFSGSSWFGSRHQYDFPG